jgi:hypothetical protein
MDFRHIFTFYQQFIDTIVHNKGRWGGVRGGDKGGGGEGERQVKWCVADRRVVSTPLLPIVLIFTWVGSTRFTTVNSNKENYCKHL